MGAGGTALVVFLALLAAAVLLDSAPTGVLGRLSSALGRPRPPGTGRWGRSLRLWQGRRSTDAQLAGLAEALAGAVSAGMSIPAALEQAAGQVGGALRGELDQVLREYQLGISLSGALRSWQRRARSPDVDFLVETLELMRRVSGPLSAPLARAATTLERRRRDRQEAWAQMAEARWSAAVVASVPPLMLVLLARGESGSWRVLTGTAAGHAALAFAAGTWLVGAVVTLLLVRPPR